MVIKSHIQFLYSKLVPWLSRGIVFFNPMMHNHMPAAQRVARSFHGNVNTQLNPSEPPTETPLASSLGSHNVIFSLFVRLSALKTIRWLASDIIELKLPAMESTDARPLKRKAPDLDDDQQPTKICKMTREEGRRLAYENERGCKERLLLRDTILQPHKCRIKAARLQALNELFAKRKVPKLSQLERNEDDKAHWMAVEELMRAREHAKVEPAGETDYWKHDLEVDIAQAISMKFDPGHFSKLSQSLSVAMLPQSGTNIAVIASLEDSRREHRGQRAFLEWNLMQPNRGGIPSDRIQWLRQKINDGVRLPSDMYRRREMKLARIQAIYYIVACRTEAGYPTYPTTELQGKGTNVMKVHHMLLKQPKEFFEADDFDVHRKFTAHCQKHSDTYLKLP